MDFDVLERGRPARPSASRILLASVVGASLAAATVAAAIVSFDANPAGPVVVTVAAMTAGSLVVRRVRDSILKGAAIGLVLGGLAAILLWPFFDVG